MAVSGFLAQIIEAAEEIEEIEIPMKERSYCNLCKKVIDKDGYCSDCQKTFDRGYQISRLAGRCVNGASRDRGFRWHARLIDRNLPEHKAMCGMQPGKRSVGWADYCDLPEDRQITCPRCLKKLEG
jgi:hypothetical protein